jgi:3-oxoacyl-[acyl-carrier protein] reductase
MNLGAAGERSIEGQRRGEARGRKDRMKLAERIALVTGAAKGMGWEICLALAREGADLVLAARDAPPLDKLQREVEALARRALVAPCDVTDEPAVERLVSRALEEYGRLDILVNAAGVTGPVETPVQDITAEEFRAVLDTNVVGTFLPIKHVLPGMIARRYGKIVNISGTSGLRGYKYRAAYSSSKWALRGLTRTVALEAGPYNINVNALHPGIVAGDRMDRLCREKARKRGSAPEQVYQEYVNEMALRRVSTAQDIANAVLFLVSDASANMTGQSVTVDGGWDV